MFRGSTPTRRGDAEVRAALALPCRSGRGAAGPALLGFRVLGFRCVRGLDQCWGNIKGYIGIMDKNMETTTMGLCRV